MEMKYNIEFAGNKKVDTHFRGFTLKSDQPIADGGDNTAPRGRSRRMEGLSAIEPMSSKSSGTEEVRP